MAIWVGMQAWCCGEACKHGDMGRHASMAVADLHLSALHGAETETLKRQYTVGAMKKKYKRVSPLRQTTRTWVEELLWSIHSIH